MIKRYSIMPAKFPHDKGELVLYEDHMKAIAELEAEREGIEKARQESLPIDKYVIVKGVRHHLYINENLEMFVDGRPASAVMG